MGRSIKILVLGGTTEASSLARRLTGDDRFAPVLSLAGRTASPHLPPIPHRIGGFGGGDGLARWLLEQSMDAVVDATHPFAARISANAVAATDAAGIPLLSVVRPAWQPTPGDDWRAARDMAAAVAALGTTPRRVWVTIGGKELAAFRAAPRHSYLVRAVDAPPVDALPPHATVILARGPFDLADERRLIADHRIELLVTKNSGGAATAAKLTAARELGVPVIMVQRPIKPAGETVSDVAAVLAWLADRHAQISSSDRGV